MAGGGAEVSVAAFNEMKNTVIARSLEGMVL
jgi:hypothetical protein